MRRIRDRTWLLAFTFVRVWLLNVVAKAAADHHVHMLIEVPLAFTRDTKNPAAKITRVAVLTPFVRPA
ncbi:MAG: hypothetical protein GEU73_02240 [Chloroflexi bacterium]|nr:hypothetical protein [Chloroflexota bacterium]